MQPFETVLTNIWSEVTTDVGNKREILAYWLHSENSQVPLFLLAVCLILRARTLGAGSSHQRDRADDTRYVCC